MSIRTPNIWMQFATLGPIGYLPGPGTWGSLCAVGLVYILNFFNPLVTYGLWIMLMLFSAYSIMRALPYFSQNDPSVVVLDELIGVGVTLIGMPTSWQFLILGFIIFRFFDITKCCGISLLEKIPGMWGIILDDCAAGIYARGILWAIWYLYA